MKVVHYPDPVLLQPAAPIEVVTAEVRERAEAMKPLMLLEEGVGLAAPQVGWGVRLLLASPDGELANTLVLVNPRLIQSGGGQEWGEEGCLSFPGIYGEVLRHREVRVEATDLDGQRFELSAEGFFARVLQHELDHLDGRLFVTRMRPADKLVNKPRLEELRRRHEERLTQTIDDDRGR